MAAGGNSSVKQQRTSRGFQRALASAILEWLLIFLLFINALFSYLITRFARYCELQAPCLLCSRLDHVLGNKKLKSYWDLFCGKHKLEISSLVFCHAHNKLVDVRGMCENCLFSFATTNKSNTETYRLLVGMLGEDSTSGFDEEPLLLDYKNNQSSIKHCSCCNEKCIARGCSQKLIQTRSFESESAELHMPLSASGEHNQHNLKMRSEERSVPITVTHVGSNGLDPLSHVGYTELKIASDSESEVLSSDDDDANGVISETNGPTDDLAHQCVQLEPCIITLSHDSVLDKLIDPISAPEPLLPVSQLESDVSKPHNGTSVESTTRVGHGLEELNWEQVDFMPDSSALTEFVAVFDVSSDAEKTIDISKDSELTFHEVPSPSNSSESPVNVTKKSELITPDEVPPSSNSGESLVNVTKESKLITHDEVTPSSNSDESLVDVTKESKLITHDDVPLSSNTQTPVDISEESKLKYHDFPLSSNAETPVDISEESRLNHHDIPLSSNSKISLVDVTKESKLISLDEVQLSSIAETPVDVSEECKLISVNDVPSSSNGKDTPSEVSKDGKVVPHDDVLPFSKSTESPVAAPKRTYITRSVELEETSVADSEEICKTGTVPNMSNEKCKERSPVSSDSGLQASNLLDLSDAYKVAVGHRGRQLSGVLAEQWIGKDSSRLSEDLKLLLSQLSAARGFEQSVSDMSSKVSLSSDELKTSDASSSNGMQILQKRISLERNESGLESLDGSTISEIEGESVVDRLKRQVEHDKKLLSALYKELEEERNASAVAVNQAMAMITRLQDEKASLHMEALQNLRMMEEQAEYDMEALQKTNELLAEKEKEIQDLEEELEFYKRKFPDESVFENILKPSDEFKEKEIIRMDHSKENTCGEESADALKNSVINNPIAYLSSEDMRAGAAGLKNSLLEFEDERSYILQSLKKLEKKLYVFSDNGHCSELANGECSGNGDRVSDSKDLNCTRESQLKYGTEGNNSSMLNDASVMRESPLVHGHVSPIEKPPLLASKENNEFDCAGPSSPVLCTGTDLASLGNEVSDLNERLEALEADQNFLELTINSLKNGEEGIRFIQEIASHLRELRSIGIRRDESFA